MLRGKAGRRSRGQTHRRHELVSSRAYDGAVDGRYDGGHHWCSRSWPTTPKIRSRAAVTARCVRNLGERPRQGAQLLGDGAAPDLRWAASSSRKFVSFSRARRPCRCVPGKSYSTTQGIVFDYWHDCKAGRLSQRRSSSRGWSPSGSRWKNCAPRARLPQVHIASLSGSCADILEHRGGDVDLRRYRDGDSNRRITTPSAKSAPSCCRRKRSFGTQSARGNRLRRELDDHVAPLRAQTAEDHVPSRSSRSAARRSFATKTSAPSLFGAMAA